MASRARRSANARIALADCYGVGYAVSFRQTTPAAISRLGVTETRGDPYGNLGLEKGDLQ
jgi:hypothetical protein